MTLELAKDIRTKRVKNEMIEKTWVSDIGTAIFNASNSWRALKRHKKYCIKTFLLDRKMNTIRQFRSLVICFPTSFPCMKIIICPDIKSNSKPTQKNKFRETVIVGNFEFANRFDKLRTNRQMQHQGRYRSSRGVACVRFILSPETMHRSQIFAPKNVEWTTARAKRRWRRSPRRSRSLPRCTCTRSSPTTTAPRR